MSSLSKTQNLSTCNNMKGEESNRGKSDNGFKNNILDKPTETSNEKHITIKSNIKCSIEDTENCDSGGSLESETLVLGPAQASVNQINLHLTSKPAVALCASPQSSFFSATLYTEAKQSFTNTEVSEYTSSGEKSGENGEAINSELIESRKTSMCRGSTGSDISDESSTSSFSYANYKPHKANDIRWEAVQAARSHYGTLDKNHFRLLKKLGGGDIGRVYLTELIGTRTWFAMKVMDKAVLENRKKLPRAQTEKEILQSLDHPFLPSLYTHFEDDKVSCLVMEFCPGGDLHALRQRRHGKCFPEHEARFYVAEVLLALEYLHMLGIIYRDLKPENVLVREDGHIMLSDFDLSLRCAVSPTLVKSSNSILETKNSGGYCVQPACIEPTCVMQPDCITPTCFAPGFFSGKPKKEKKTKTKSKNEVNHQLNVLPELLAEPTNARSMSFVGTHEYLAPEIIKGEGHGSAVDWWTFGIFLYELLFGRTPFKGAENRATLFNVVGQPLRFPESPSVSFAARDLIRGLLVKEPQHRLAYRRGATEIKQHPFFQSVNWALIRCTSPPEVPKNYMINTPTSTKPKAPTNGCIKRTVNSQSQSAPIKSHHGMRIAHSCRSLISSTYQYIYHTHVSNLPKPFSFFHFPSESSTLILENISLSMASDNVSNMAGDDDKYGFRRPEMYQSNITGTVDAYDRHVFLCYKRPEAWASRVEDSEFDPLPKLFASALKARKNDITVKTKLTVCDGGDGTDSSDGDVLVFPEMIKYRCLKDSDVDSFVEDVLVNGKQWVAGEQEKLTGSFVFVCAHGSRDRRCGVCGPVLIQKLKEEIEVRGLNDQVFVKPCSHIGGHKYAGNLIIYGPSQDGKITGHWYGYVTPDDVPEMLDQHIGKGEVIERLWRGQMGVSAEENEKAKDQKLPNAEDVKKSKEKHQENGSENTKENLSGCCQGANGFTCCKDGNVEQSSKDEDRTYTKEGPLCKDEGKNYTKEGPHCNLSNWIRTWEQNDFLAGVGLVGAVAAVAVAYSYYKRSG